MLKKIIRMGLPLAVALGLVLPFVNTGFAQEKGTEGKPKKKTQKPKGKSGGEKRKAEQPKAQ